MQGPWVMRIAGVNTPFRILLVVALAAFALLGCQQMKERSILGKWTSVETGSTMEFFPDQTAQVSAGPLKIAGRYTFLEDGRLKVDVTVLGITTTRTWRTDLDGDKLTVTDEDGKVDVLTRTPTK